MSRRTASVAALVLLAALCGCDGYFFYPRGEYVPNPRLAGVDRRDLIITSPDGIRLLGWVLTPPGKARGTILFLHGNAENISTHVNNVLWLVPAGYRVVLFDYRGYGNSEGTPDMDGIHRDALAALDAVFGMEEVDKDRVAVLGQSLGGSVAVHTVAVSPRRERLRALVVDSAFSSFREIAREKVGSVPVLGLLRSPLAWLVTERYSARLWIGRIGPVPLLVIHGDADGVVPVSHGRILYDAAREPKRLWIVPGAGHIGSFGVPEIRERFLRYLSAAFGDSPAEAAGKGIPARQIP